MKTHLFRTIAMASMLGLAALSTPVLAADGDGMQTFSRQVQSMANKDGMVSKKDFMAMMEKKFDAMDKSRKGMLSTQDIMHIFSDRTGQ